MRTLIAKCICIDPGTGSRGPAGRGGRANEPWGTFGADWGHQGWGGWQQTRENTSSTCFLLLLSSFTFPKGVEESGGGLQWASWAPFSRGDSDSSERSGCSPGPHSMGVGATTHYADAKTFLYHKAFLPPPWGRRWGEGGGPPPSPPGGATGPLRASFWRGLRLSIAALETRLDYPGWERQAGGGLLWEDRLLVNGSPKGTGAGSRGIHPEGFPDA